MLLATIDLYRLQMVYAKSWNEFVLRIRTYLLENGHLDRQQSGFTPKKSTEDNLLRLTQEINHGFSLGENTICVFFDVEKAFDQILSSAILRQLHALGIKGHLLYYLRDFLQKRKFRVRIGNQLSTTHNQATGIPQGSVVSPLLFILALLGIDKCLVSSVNYSLFADDLAIYIRGTNIQRMTRKIQDSIIKLEEWYKSRGLKFSSSKSKVVLFSRKKSAPTAIKLYLAGKIIPMSETAPFLGLLLDQHLTWKSYVTELKQKCLTRMNLLKSLSRKSWGADRKLLLRLYTTIVRSVLDYGSPIYGNAKPTILQKLDVVQNEALRICTGAFRTSPISSLQVDAGMLPLSHHRNYLSLTLYAKIQRDTTHVNHYRTLYLPHTSTTVQSFGTRCRALLSEYRIEPEQNADEPFRFYKMHILEKVYLTFEDEWKLVPTTNRLRALKPNTEPWTVQNLQNRRNDVALTRIRIGHTLITHRPYFSGIITPMCEHCHTERLTISHLINQCSGYTQERRRIYERDNTTDEITMMDTMAAAGKLLEYLRNTTIISMV